MGMFGRKKAKAYDAPVRIGNTHGRGARDRQQDNFGISDISNADLCLRRGVFGMVADGIGGLAGGFEISAVATATMLRCFSEDESSGQPSQDLLNMLFAANDDVNRYLEAQQEGGTTVVAAIVSAGGLYWVSVGDSRICLVRGGALMQLNREHTYAVELDERAAMGEISWDEAANHPKRDALTSYLGMGALERIDRNIRPLHLLASDRVLLMTDGVFNALSDEEILQTMVYPPHECGDELRRSIAAKDDPNQDNFTAVIFEYRGA